MSTETSTGGAGTARPRTPSAPDAATSGTGALRTRARRTGGRRRGGGRTGMAAGILLTPFFVLFTIAMLIPVGYAIWLSLFTQKLSGLGFSGPHSVFDGLGNYVATLGDAAFRDGFRVLAGYVVCYIPIMVGGALVIALLLDTALARARRFFQLALFLPHAIPGLIAALIWVYLYTPGLSPVVDAMRSGGIGLDFFSSNGALPSVVNIALWEWLGYNVVIFYASLQAVDRSLLEAAAVDGAGNWRQAWSIKLPLIRSSVFLVLLFTVIGSLQLFTEPLLLSGSGSAITSTWTPNLYAYAEAFQLGDYGRAAAASVLIALVAAVLSFAVTKLANRKGARS